tara:strand:+ start:272 stop:673 length:402 start_codon:yes stop_codon:yes gene_type:complete
MHIANVEESGTVHFVTAADSPKVAEIRYDGDVGITCQSGQCYVSASGKAKLLEDRKKIAELYQKPWDAWFEGKDDPNILLIRVEVDEAEYWDYSGTKGIRYLWKATKAAVSDDPKDKLDDKCPNNDAHAKVHL